MQRGRQRRTQFAGLRWFEPQTPLDEPHELVAPRQFLPALTCVLRSALAQLRDKPASTRIVVEQPTTHALIFDRLSKARIGTVTERGERLVRRIFRARDQQIEVA